MQKDYELLITIVPLELRDAMIDTLMAIPQLSGFNIKLIQGFSRQHAEYSNKEKVQGFMDLAQFEILISQDTKEHVSDAISPLCALVNSKYWYIPVLDSGHFS